MQKPDGIYNNSTGLYESINEALAHVTFPEGWTDIDKETGQVTDKQPLYPFDPDDLNKKYEFPNDDHPTGVRMNDYSGKGVPPEPTFQDPYVDNTWTGTEHMFNISSTETLDYIIKHVQIAMKPRMDKLESDYNSLLSTLSDVLSDMSALTTSAVSHIHRDTAGRLNWRYIEVVQTSDLVDYFERILLEGGTDTRQSNTTDAYIKEHEVITTDSGDEFEVHIR